MFPHHSNSLQENVDIMLHAVIMAGGTGTRFWPESRAARPKQLLRMVGSRTMIRETVDRLGDLVPLDRILIATTSSLAGKLADELSELPREAMLVEPCKRNTAPCIGLAATRIAREDPDGIMVVMPADHVIGPDEVFQAAVRQAAELVESTPSRIVTFGIRPTYPAESFGYVERGETISDAGSASVFRVKRFREKPDAATAVEYVEAGSFFWNSGIFVWKAQTILDALAEHQPEMFERLQRIGDAAGSPNFTDVLAEQFSAIKGISIDYAVMEHANDVVVIEAPFDWDDLGSWQSLTRLHDRDDQGNTIVAKHVGIDTKGTIIRGGDDHLIVTLGLTDCIIVHTDDATLVANKHDEESIRQVVELLESRGLGEYL